MTDTGTYPSTLQRRSVSESDTDLLNSTINQRGNPSLYFPPDKAKSNPNISVSGFIDESPYSGPSTRLQSQWEGMETRINKIMDCFQKLKAKINEWDKSLKDQTVSPVEINQQFSSLSKVITELSNQALLGRVSIPICRNILSLTDIIARIKRNGLKGADSQIDIAIQRSNLNSDCSFCNEEFILHRTLF